MKRVAIITSFPDRMWGDRARAHYGVRRLSDVRSWTPLAKYLFDIKMAMQGHLAVRIKTSVPFRHSKQYQHGRPGPDTKQSRIVTGLDAVDALARERLSTLAMVREALIDAQTARESVELDRQQQQRNLEIDSQIRFKSFKKVPVASIVPGDAWGTIEGREAVNIVSLSEALDEDAIPDDPEDYEKFSRDFMRRVLETEQGSTKDWNRVQETYGL